MKLVGLTGGIGAGKSTVAALLDARGAVVIDADAVVRELQAPGTPVFAAIVDRFGPGVVTPEGDLDRSALAGIVFADPGARADLEAIVHPAVRAELLARVRGWEESDRVVVLEVPLLVESEGSYPVQAVVVVDAPEEVAVARLVARGLSSSDARARVDAQIDRATRLAAADRVIDNAGDPAALDAQVEALWHWIGRL